MKNSRIRCTSKCKAGYYFQSNIALISNHSDIFFRNLTARRWTDKLQHSSKWVVTRLACWWRGRWDAAWTWGSTSWRCSAELVGTGERRHGTTFRTWRCSPPSRPPDISPRTCRSTASARSALHKDVGVSRQRGTWGSSKKNCSCSMQGAEISLLNISEIFLNKNHNQ